MFRTRVVRQPCLGNHVLDNGEPSNYEEAMAGPDSDKWLEAMKSEIGSMYENESMDFD